MHEKENKNLLKSYRPIGLLPIFGKVFERILFKDLFNYFHRNQFFTKCQSGFLPSDSCISQLLPIVHDINSSFDCDSTIDVRGLFLDISKHFNKVWHDRIIFKLETYGVKGKLLTLIKNCLHALLTSTWELVKSCVPQRSVLGPLMFLIYMICQKTFNQLVKFLQMTHSFFPTFLIFFPHVFNKDISQDELNNDLQKVIGWVFQWKMQFNPDPNKQAQEVTFSKKAVSNNSLPLSFNKTEVRTCQSQKYL